MKEIIFLVGPTAIGKTAVALLLAEKLNAEIISCDSMQVYKGFDIISAKPTKPQRKRVLHHLIDEVGVDKRFSVTDYCRRAKKAIQKIHKKGKTALIVGGTGMYMQVLLDGIFVQDKKSALIRRRLYKDAACCGSGSLYERLKKVDAAAAAKIHPNDTRRIIRALEVFETTGRPISKLQQRRRGGIWGKFDIQLFGLNCNRQELYRRVDRRVDAMFQKGVIAEAKRLRKRKIGLTVSQGIGIKEIGDYLDGGYDESEAKRLIKRNSRRFAKRQLTWFRKEKRIRWISLAADDSPCIIAERIVRKLS